MLTDVLLRLRSLFKRDSVERELDEELRFHVERLIEMHVRNGLTREDATRRARLELGGVDQIKEEHHDARGIRPLGDVGRDLRLALRQFRRAPGFAALAVLCLGLGIGVNTSIFGVVNSVLLRPMHVQEPDQLVRLGRGERAPWAYPVFTTIEARSRSFSGLTFTVPMESDLDVSGQSSFLTAEVVTATYADVLSVRPALGRWIADDREAAAVISHAVWERHFHLDPNVLGRVVRSQTETYTIVGVAPKEFVGVFAPIRTDLWVPIQTRSRIVTELERGNLTGMLKWFGRLREGTTVQQAAAELNALDAQLVGTPQGDQEVSSPISIERVRAVAEPGFRRRAAMLSTLLGIVVGLVLLIACVNVGNLLLVRGALRQREFAVRRALGASRSRLIQQLLIESLVLAAGGAACGLVFAVWANRALSTSVPPFLGAFAVEAHLSVDWRVIAFVTLAALTTTVLCGLVPAWRTSQDNGLVAFKNEIGGGMPRRRPLGLVAQVVMSLVLLFVAGSFLQAVRQLHATDPGFEVQGRLYAYVLTPSPPFTPEGRERFYSHALEQLRALPGIRAVGLTSTLPLMPVGSDCAGAPDGARITSTASGVDARYFDALGIGTVAGRVFTPDEVGSGAATVIVSESLARRIWVDPASAVGQRIALGCDSQLSAVVIGVVADAAVKGLGEPAQPHVYRPLSRDESSRLMAIIIDATTDPAAMVQPVQRTLLAMGQGIRVYRVQTLAMHVEQRYAPFRWIASLLSSFGLLALILAGVGLYGVIAYRVTLRTQEIGVRMALGARRSDVFRDVLRYGLAIVLVGVVIGEGLTAGLTGVVASVQDGIRPTGVTTHLTIGAIWIAVALLACYLPAARAARVDPLTALRHE
jgi:predicted permease